MIYYLEAVFDDDSETLLTLQRGNLGLSTAPMPKRGFHATIAYSKVPFHYVVRKFPELCVAREKALCLFGSSRVLTLKSPWLEKQHELVMDDDATWSFPTYVPHVTLAEQMEKIPPYLSLVPIPFRLKGINYHQFDDKRASE